VAYDFVETLATKGNPVSEQVVPRPVGIAGVLVGIQSLAGFAFVVAVLVGSGSQSMTNRLGEAGYFLLLSAGIAAVAVGLWRGARWARTPAIVVELLLVGVAWYALGGAQRPELGIPVGVYCLAVIVLLFLRGSRQWAARDHIDDADDAVSEN
jgi:hypothetical protein